MTCGNLHAQDAMKSPIKLTCSHLFCDACISTWLARCASRPTAVLGCFADGIHRTALEGLLHCAGNAHAPCAGQ